MTEAPAHPHNAGPRHLRRARRRGAAGAGAALQPHAGEIQRPPAHAGQHTDEVLADWGVDAATIAKLRETGAIA